ncbi:MAG: hypothetical protein RIS84_564 [Pseudomonadota bacterium]
MQLHEKIKLIRTVKGWSQEEVAERLSMSVNGYANIERGETDIHLSRLEQIARIFEIELAELFGMNDKNIFNFSGNAHNNYCQNSYHCNPTELQHTIEKLQLMYAQLEQENSFLKIQLCDLREMLNFLKDKK